MNIEHKTFFYIISILLIFFILISVISIILFPFSFSAIEDREAMVDNERVMNAFDHELEHITWTTHDWASWDSTYDYLTMIHPQFLDSDLSEDNLLRLEVNDFIIIFTNSSVFFTKSVDLQKKKEVPTDPYLLNVIQKNLLLMNSTENLQSMSGYISLPDGPVIFAKFPITQSNGEGQVYGSLILSKKIEKTLINSITNSTKVSFQLIRYNDSPLFYESLENFKPGPIDNKVIVRKNLNTLFLYTPISDLNGGKNFVLQVKKDRTVVNESLTMVLTLLLIILLSISALITLFLLLFYLLVYRPVSRLNLKIQRITDKHSIDERVRVKGNDEIASLGYSFNMLLEQIEEKEKALHSEREMYRLFAERIDDSIILASSDYSVRYANTRASILLSDYGDLMNWFDIRNFFEQSDFENFSSFIEEVQKNGVKQIISLHFKMNNEKLWFSASFISLKADDLNDKTLLIVLHDITENVESHMEFTEKNLTQLEYDMEEFQILNDSIRNPLTVISGLISLSPNPVSKQIEEELGFINNIIKDIDISWAKSGKLHKFLEENLKFSKNRKFE